MRVILAALLASVTLISPALASDRTDVLEKVKQSMDAYNANDGAAMAAIFLPSSVIVDDVAPFRFEGPSALSNWVDASKAEAQKDDITEQSEKALDPTEVIVDEQHAYVSLPAIYYFKQHGKPAQQDCINTIALEKIGGTWYVSNWSWAIR